MALVTCPNCGKQISDTNDKCFNCGFNLVSPKENKQNLQEYYKLSVANQEELKKEFYKQKPSYDSYMQKHNKFLNKINISYYVNIVSSVLFFILLIGGQIYHGATHKDTPMIVLVFILISLFVWLIALSINIVQRRVIYKRYRRNELIIEKKYQKWLKEEKNINYTVSFTKKQKKDKDFFDQINVEKDEIEV